MSETQKRKHTNKQTKLGSRANLGCVYPQVESNILVRGSKETHVALNPRFCLLNGSPKIGIAGLSFALNNIESNIYGYNNIVF